MYALEPKPKTSTALWAAVGYGVPCGRLNFCISDLPNLQASLILLLRSSVFSLTIPPSLSAKAEKMLVRRRRKRSSMRIMMSISNSIAEPFFPVEILIPNMNICQDEVYIRQQAALFESYSCQKVADSLRDGWNAALERGNQRNKDYDNDHYA